MIYSFFFSSRRRHTRWPRDWSSDVCSSDLIVELTMNGEVPARPEAHISQCLARERRSEERRVGKECRSRWWTSAYKKKAKVSKLRDNSSQVIRRCGYDCRGAIERSAT